MGGRRGERERERERESKQSRSKMGKGEGWERGRVQINTTCHCTNGTVVSLLP